MIKLKRAYEPAGSDDGPRFLIDGLRRWFDHDPKKWPEFRRRYFREPDANAKELDFTVGHGSQ
jgi:uncharacterized protein YeaO (DUF488 family)